MSEARRQFATAAEFEEYREAIYARHEWRFGDFWLNTVTQATSVGRLGWQLFKLLALLVEACPLPVSRATLSHELDVQEESVKGAVRRLRQRVGAERIATTPAGYLFVPFPLEGER